MAKRIQDFREFNSSREEKEKIEASRVAAKSNKTKVGAVSVSAQSKKTTKVSAGPASTKSNKTKAGVAHVSTKPANTNKPIKAESKAVSSKSNKSNNKFITVFFLLLVIIGIGVGCLFSPTFNLSGVIIENGENITSEEIRNSFDVALGTNVFRVDYKNIEKSVENLAYIQSANANLQIPSEIKIEYIERKPFALVKYLESYLVMDKYGYILEITREKKFEKLPIIYNIEFDTYEIGKQLEDTAKTKFDNVVYLLENASKNDFQYSISEINYESIGNVKMWVTEEDIEIIYGEIDRNIIVDKLNYISEILYKVKGKSGRLDVSSDSYLEKTVFTERF